MRLELVAATDRIDSSVTSEKYTGMSCPLFFTHVSRAIVDAATENLESRTIFLAA